MGQRTAPTDRVAIVRADEHKAAAFPFLEAVIKTGGHDWQEICRKIDESHCQLWFALTDRPVAALVSQATTDNVLECLIAGGTGAKQWAGVAERHLAAFAAENGLNRLRIWGRVGWARIFPSWERVGVEDGYLILEKLL